MPDLAGLDGESRATLERALRESAFAFTITRVERVYLEFELRRLLCRACAKVTREHPDFLADNPFYTKRFAWFVGRRCRDSSIKVRRRGAAP